MKIQLRTAPWRHQREAIKFALQRDGALWNMAMGTGKSLCAIAIIGATRERSRTLVLCPKSVLEVWPGELEKHAGFEYELLAKHEPAAKRVKSIAAARASCASRLVVAVNYEAATTPALKHELLRDRWDLVVLDESHRAKNARGRLGKFVEDLGKRAARRLALSGTPTPHSPLDIFAQARFLAPAVFGTSWTRFCARFAKTAPVPDAWLKNERKPGQPPAQRIVGVRDLPGLERAMASFAYKVDASVLELPEAQHLVVPIVLSDASRRLYRDIEELCYARVRDAAGNRAEIQANGALAQLLKLQAITGGQVVDDEGHVRRCGKEKLDALSDLIEDLNEPVVVFCRFRTELAQVHEAARAAKVESLELSGARNDYAAWRAEGAPPVLAVQLQAGNAGIDLTRARYCVYWSKTWSLGDYQQSLARVLRPGQRRNVTYIHLLARETVDEELHAALEKRADFIEAFLSRVAEHQGATPCTKN